MKLLFSCYIGLATLMLTSCATPQATLDQANNGAALIMSLQTELENFRIVQANVAKARIESVHKQAVQIATYESESGFDDRVLAAAGKMDAAKLVAMLKDLSDSRIKDDQALAVKLAEINDTLNSLLMPLPDISNKLTASQKALSVLGEELSTKERFEIASKFAQSIKAEIAGNKNKIEDAKEAAPISGVQSAPKITKE